MATRDFWTMDAEAMEQTLEGTRLVLCDMTAALVDAWRWVRHAAARRRVR